LPVTGLPAMMLLGAIAKLAGQTIAR
jgi:hypothetical protein